MKPYKEPNYILEAIYILDQRKAHCAGPWKLGGWTGCSPPDFG